MNTLIQMVLVAIPFIVIIGTLYVGYRILGKIFTDFIENLKDEWEEF